MWSTFVKYFGSKFYLKSKTIGAALLIAASYTFIPYLEHLVKNNPKFWTYFLLFVFVFFRLITKGAVTMKINKKIPLAVLLIFFVGCATVQQEPDPKIYYKRDMSIKVDGKKNIGVATLPYKSKYSIEFVAKGPLDLFTFTTCNREHTQEEAGSFFNKNKVKYDYVPNELEKVACPIKAGGYDIVGKHSWAYILKDLPQPLLPAQILCNGQSWRSNGTTVCQSKEGLLQRISFDVEVVFSPEAAIRKECQEIDFENKDDKVFTYTMPNRECIYSFMEKKEPHKEHALATIGYEEILVREL